MGLIQGIKWNVSSYNRRRKLHQILGIISDEDSIIDVGVGPFQEYREDRLGNYIEEYFLSINRSIDALGLEKEDFAFFISRYTNCRLHLFDGRNFPEVEKKYDVGLCAAVIEHVGTRDEQLQWLKGLLTICKKLIITTPNRYFPVEMHTNAVMKHILSSKFKQYLLSKRNICLFSYREFIKILKEAGFNIVITKKNRFIGLTLDFLIVATDGNDT